MHKLILAITVGVLLFSTSSGMEMEEIIQAKTKFLVDGLQLNQDQADQISEIFRDQIDKMQDLLGDRGRPTLEEIEILEKYERITRTLINRLLTPDQLKAFNQTDLELLPAPQLLVLNDRLDLTLGQAVKIRKIIREYMLKISIIDREREDTSPKFNAEIQKIWSEGLAKIDEHLTYEQREELKRLLKEREENRPGPKTGSDKGED